MSAFIQPDDIAVLEQIASNSASELLATRAKLLLLLNAGKSSRQVSGEVGLSMSTINRWRREYRSRGMAIFPATETPQAKQKKQKKSKPENKAAKAKEKPAKVKKKPTKAKEKPAKEKKGDAKNKKRLQRISSAIKSAGEVIKKGEKKLGKIRKSKSYKKAVDRLDKERAAAMQLLKRMKKGKKASDIDKQLKRLEERVSALEEFRKKAAKK